MIVCCTLGVLDSRRNPEAADWYQDMREAGGGRDFLNLTPAHHKGHARLVATPLYVHSQCN